MNGRLQPHLKYTVGVFSYICLLFIVVSISATKMFAAGMPAAEKADSAASSSTSAAATATNTTATPAAATAAPAATTSTSAPADPVKAGADMLPSLMNELQIMKQRIADLEAEVKANESSSSMPAAALDGAREKLLPTAAVPAAAVVQAAVATPAAAPAAPELGAEKTTKTAPFSESDWSWVNSNPHQVDTPMATKYFTPEFRADINYTIDFNHPSDDSLGGSTETFRSDEVQVEQLSFGGDIRIDNVRGRFLTMYGMFATTTPRNDASPNRGQWDLTDAYRYVSEAWGGYHWDKMHGINMDAGIFVSYIGLFSYYNFDNWAYQPSYVSSNTPWFFNGIRWQFFPTAKLKIEPWFINGWQSYGRYNSKPGLGGQILWRPYKWLDIVTNNYGMGEDDAGLAYRHRIHTDNSIEVKYYDNKSNYIDRAAFTFTADAGCEFGLNGNGPPNENVACHGDPKAPASSGGGNSLKQEFLGWMAYNRVWWDKDLYAITIGGGQMTNPGRYLTLLPPINGATATSGTPYFTENPGDTMKAWDGTFTFDYMPSQFITFRLESGYRYSDTPYWTGRGGITPPAFAGGPPVNNGQPGQYACANGAPSGFGYGSLSSAEAFCYSSGNGTGANTSAIWWPDLRTNQTVSTIAIMVRF